MICCPTGTLGRVQGALLIMTHLPSGSWTGRLLHFRYSSEVASPDPSLKAQTPPFPVTHCPHTVLRPCPTHGSLPFSGLSRLHTLITTWPAMDLVRSWCVCHLSPLPVGPRGVGLALFCPLLHPCEQCRPVVAAHQMMGGWEGRWMGRWEDGRAGGWLGN